MDDGRFMPTPHAGGAWNVAEQHVAPAIGLLVHAVEADHAARRADRLQVARLSCDIWGTMPIEPRSEEHTSELQSLMRNSYAVFCLKTKKQTDDNNTRQT